MPRDSPIYEWYMPRYAGVSNEGKAMWYYTDTDGTLKTTDVYGMRAITHVEVHTQISMVALEQR